MPGNSSAWRLSVFASFKKESSYGHVDYQIILIVSESVIQLVKETED